MTERKTAIAFAAKDDMKASIETKASNGIVVRIHIPESVPENTRRQKINRIYDILNPAISR
ncbi:hypothetical protein D1641_11580 [Colidextribacter sp. OB.20]|uniref:hypothetical protein n=1 Tax=Colidextribacter sp. OB.20 TaxID=2304568 RepID=UPI00136B8199|nr:hypothetical protein [Colidextribacter sp. OB.20]NBI10647.1 hypothetical protein [Colidextribacter sp. OB.20]